MKIAEEASFVFPLLTMSSFPVSFALNYGFCISSKCSVNDFASKDFYQVNINSGVPVFKVASLQHFYTLWFDFYKCIWKGFIYTLSECWNVSGMSGVDTIHWCRECFYLLEFGCGHLQLISWTFWAVCWNFCVLVLKALQVIVQIVIH